MLTCIVLQYFGSNNDHRHYDIILLMGLLIGMELVETLYNLHIISLL